MNNKYDRASFERYAEQMGFHDFEISQDSADDYRNPHMQGRWNFWRASRDAAALASQASKGAGVPEGWRVRHLCNAILDGCVVEATKFDAQVVLNSCADAAPLPAQAQPVADAAPVEAKPVAWLVEFEYLGGTTQRGPNLKVVAEHWGKQCFATADKSEACLPDDFARVEVRNYKVTPLGPLIAQPSPAQGDALSLRNVDEIIRMSDQSVRIRFMSARSASEFEQSIRALATKLVDKKGGAA